ncbi:diguanylate cyclase (GGDEF) domain-containing protein [Rhizobium sp. RU20A]|uniref:GGDEF domain-containing protein n=1 Tax=Rhizobium sp. RU20A TaxID=1907412 RepID=UPI000956963A|nr:GGDEF domain-containing protein [Rhizobium sp. RU20A]SIQ11620.1 diguanylate cyclase (GGDEF) domain-containing protein [Rhizobium sp. RU20A]
MADMHLYPLNMALLIVEAAFYVFVMVGLLHLRHRIGLGVFLAALGVMHFIETYLAAVFYIPLAFGVISPGSVVFFAGKLMMILLLYVKEDAATVRQPIYGLFIGNFLVLFIGLMLRFHETLPVVPGRFADLAFLNEMGWLMVWGTLLLYIDAIVIILLYERLGSWLSRHITLRLFICGAAVLTFDQIGFYAALRTVNDAPGDVFWGGWYAKMGAALFYAVAIGLYVKATSSAARGGATGNGWRPLGDVFNDLTFRERYETLLAHSGRDGLTGALDRGRLEADGSALAARAALSGLIIVDADHFKSVNDRFGHPEGDRVLRDLVRVLQGRLPPATELYRYGGEEFVVLADGVDTDLVTIAEGLRGAVESELQTRDGQPVTISLGLAKAPADGADLATLVTTADRRLYRAKQDGRNRVVAAG